MRKMSRTSSNVIISAMVVVLLAGVAVWLEISLNDLLKALEEVLGGFSDSQEDGPLPESAGDE